MDCSCHSLVMDSGGSPPNERMTAKMPPVAARTRRTWKKRLLPSPGGSRARGPWGPKAIQYAVGEGVSVRYSLGLKVRGISEVNDRDRNIPLN